MNVPRFSVVGCFSDACMDAMNMEVRSLVFLKVSLQVLFFVDVISLFNEIA